MVQAFLEIFDEKDAREYIDEALSPPSTSRKSRPIPKPGTDIMYSQTTSTIQTRLSGTRIVFSGNLPQDLNCEVRVQNQENWTTL